jgi:hypothetical protein
VRKKSATRPSSSGGVAITLNTEVLVFIAFGAIVLLAIAFGLGYRAGAKKSRANRISQNAVGARTERTVAQGAENSGNTARPLTTRNTEAPTLEHSFYTLRTVAGIRLSSAREVRDFFRQKGYDAFVVKSRSGRGYAVNVGRLRSKRDGKAATVKASISRMKYQNKEEEFSGAYWIYFELSHIGSIVQ